MLGNGLITEEVFTVQAAAELLQKTKHIVDAVHHGEAEKMLLPIKCGWKRKTGRPLETTSQFRSNFSPIKDLLIHVFYSAPPQVKW